MVGVCVLSPLANRNLRQAIQYFISDRYPFTSPPCHFPMSAEDPARPGGSPPLSDCNPYKTRIFPPEGLPMKISSLFPPVPPPASDPPAPLTRPTLAAYMSEFLRSTAAPSPVPSPLPFEHLNLPSRSALSTFAFRIELASDRAWPACALPHPPAPPPDRLLLPPKLWGRHSAFAECEDPARSPRRRVRPRKSAADLPGKAGNRARRANPRAPNRSAPSWSSATATRARLRR
jgi:hypothetical protein